MTKFQKLAQIFKDIDLLESYGDFKAADILHKKFIRLAQNEVTPVSYKTPQDDRGPTYKKRFNEKLKAGLAAQGIKKDNIIGSIYADQFFFDEDKKQLESLIRGTVSPSFTVNNQVSNVFTELKTQLAKDYMAKLDAAKGEWDLDFIKMQYEKEGLAPFEQKILDDHIVNIKKTKRNKLMTGLQNSLNAVSVPSENSTTQTTNESSIPKLQERVKYYSDKINEYNALDENIPKEKEKKSRMKVWLSKYIQDNYNNKLIDQASYNKLMNAFGGKYLAEAQDPSPTPSVIPGF